jgi:succinyl-CoA synthetase alpha subunit
LGEVAKHLQLAKSAHKQLEKLVEDLVDIFMTKEAFVLETKVGFALDGTLGVNGARFGFDDAAFRSSKRQEEVHSLRNESEEVLEEVEAEKDGIVYVKYDSSRHPHEAAIAANKL